MKVCRFLRWKGHHDDSDRDEVRLTFERNQTPYQCLKTCQPWGDDDEPAAPETCGPERGCYVARQGAPGEAGS